MSYFPLNCLFFFQGSWKWCISIIPTKAGDPYFIPNKSIQIPNKTGPLFFQDPSPHVSHEKKTLLLSIDSWLVNDGILIMVYYNPYIIGQDFIPYITQPTRCPFFIAPVASPRSQAASTINFDPDRLHRSQASQNTLDLGMVELRQLTDISLDDVPNLQVNIYISYILHS